MRAIGFCHLLLSISSTRVSFVLDEVVASRPREVFRSRDRRAPPFFRRRRTFEHPAVSRRQSDCGGRSNVSFFRCYPATVEPLSCLSRLLDAPACGSLRSGPHIEAAPRALRDVAREDLAVPRSGTTSIERCISSTRILRRSSRDTGNRARYREHVRLSSVLPPTRRLSLRLFTATIPRCISQTWWSRLGPRAHPRI